MLLENIFIHLFESSSFFRQVLPHFDSQYLQENYHKIIFDRIKQYNSKYGKQAKINDIKLILETDNNVSEKDTELCYQFLDSLKNTELVSDEESLIKQTELFVQDRALELAILDSVDILQNKKDQKGMIEEKIRKALSIEFDVKIGMDYFADAPNRYQKYQDKEEVIPTDIEEINKALNGGWRKKAIHVLLGSTNVGKTHVMCHFAAHALKSGKNVLYISGEMSEDTGIGKRIDANLLDISMDDFNETLEKKSFFSKIKELFTKTKGKLIVKEYPAGTANANHLRNLIEEIKLKKGWIPDIVFLDYLNLFASYRLPSSQIAQTYQYIKAVTEEMRGLATIFNFALVSATQTNRDGMKAGTETDMTNTSDSNGINFTADFVGALICTPELFEQFKMLLKVLKSRFSDNLNKIYTIGTDRNHMRLRNLENDEMEIPIHLKDKLKMIQKQEDQIKNESVFDFN